MNVLAATLPALALALPAPAVAQGAERFEAERMRVAPGVGHVVRDGAASGQRALLISGRGRARARIRAPGPARLTVVARARPCAGNPRLTVAIDGARVLSARVRAERWAPVRSRPAVAAGAHAITVRLANPRRSRACRRAVLIDALLLVPHDRWAPAPRTTWQWQLTSPIDQSVDAEMFDIDLFDNAPSVVASLHGKGARVVCYLSAGSVERGRPDTSEFPAAVIGKPLEGWPGERWLDVRRLDVLGPILERRLDLCRAKGFDAVEADNVDGYDNASGFPLTAADQLRYNRFLARAAHARGLSIGLKNDLAQVAELEPDFDWALNEQCFQYDECDRLRPFVRAGKAVFVAEYELDVAAFCPRAEATGLMAMRKRLALDAWRQTCW